MHDQVPAITGASSLNGKNLFSSYPQTRTRMWLKTGENAKEEAGAAQAPAFT